MDFYLTSTMVDGTSYIFTATNKKVNGKKYPLQRHESMGTLTKKKIIEFLTTPSGYQLSSPVLYKANKSFLDKLVTCVDVTNK